jgi:hypothetical protein
VPKNKKPEKIEKRVAVLKEALSMGYFYFFTASKVFQDEYTPIIALFKGKINPLWLGQAFTLLMQKNT